jgi:hypothetical protein
MVNLAQIPAVSSERRAVTPSVLVLKATDDGWALIGQRGEVVFEAEGLRGRQACLSFARDHGVLALIR